MVGIAALMRRRHYPVRGSSQALLILGAVIPTVVGAAVISALTFWALPTGVALGEQDVLRRNVIAAATYCAAAIPIATAWGYMWMTLPANRQLATVDMRILLQIPARLAVIHGSVWTGGALYLVALNFGTPWLATTLGVSTLLGGLVTTAISYWLTERAARPAIAEYLTANPPRNPRPPGLRLRAVIAWVLGTGVPLLMLLLVAASALAVDFPDDRLAIVVLVVGSCAVVSGLVVAALTGSTTADPIDEVTRGMQKIERGEYDVSVPVFDASELGLLQAGFNTMASGLRERERLRDLFSRHVGRDVARLAEQTASDDGVPAMGGVKCEVAVVFVDLVDSTRLATVCTPEELVAMLNEFFVLVVDVVERHGGLVNKFEGDAVLAVFGAPVPTGDDAGLALQAARELNVRMRSLSQEIRAGIGVSAGTVVAGNVGHPSRYEYTIIGDPVNEAARLTDAAKRLGGVVASSDALVMASSTEAEKWRVTGSIRLRGRETDTVMAIPTVREDTVEPTR